ncbi:MAG TPA: DUF1289 domain-containing protein [Rhodocyclaceae bacterium]|nr:DUF1289 domain-containing protein [Rhodocyclaceae bacterium]HNF61271.1 DUF1289 domain-containing protein [Rhodocyclaceae bacterium]HNI82007.1 DUF1289 domain-containing protein [Rhodocyclaceae bacterium]
MSVASPCTCICRIDPMTGWCAGCRRTLTEIAEWGAAGDGRRQAILDGLAQRRWPEGAPADKASADVVPPPAASTP